MASLPHALWPPQEDNRLAVLRAYDILHSLQEPLFTKLVELTAKLFDVPISLIALVDAEEVEYKATYGLPDLRAQSRVEAICALPVKYEQAVIFTDLALDNSLTMEAATAAHAKGLRFYAGAPLRLRSQACIGTLCLIDRQPRAFSAPEQQVLEHFAHVVARLIAVRHHCLAKHSAGPDSWTIVSSKLKVELQALVALVEYLVAYHGTLAPVPALALASVAERLTAFHKRLQEYQAEEVDF